MVMWNQSVLLLFDSCCSLWHYQRHTVEYFYRFIKCNRKEHKESAKDRKDFALSLRTTQRSLRFISRQ